MSDAERLRKQVYELTLEDMYAHPLWGFCSDEEGEENQEEATVKPSERNEVPGFSPGAYILACDVRFADGTTGVGYVYSGQDHDFGCTQPNVFTGSGQVALWLGWLRFVKDPASAVAAGLAKLTKDAASIFPMRFQTRPHINGAPMELTVKSFMAKGVDQKLTESSYVMVH